MCSCTMHCWMVCFSVVTVFQDQYVFLYHALLDGLFQCCHCVSGPVCVPVPCTVGWSVSMLSLCFRTSMCSCTMLCWMVCFNAVTVVAGPVCVPVPCSVGWSVSVLSLCLQDQYVFMYHALLDGLFQCCYCVSGPVCVPVPCSVGWSVSMLSLCFRTSMCSCTMHCWMVCFNVVTVFQDQYVFMYHALLDGLFQCCYCVSGPVCVPVPCSIGWSVSMLSLCFRTSMCSCTMHCWMVCFNVVTVFQDQYVFLYHALLDGLFQCCHCVSGPVCVPVPCTVGCSVSMLSLCFRTSMCSCTMLCWMVCFNAVTVFQDQYAFLYHALLDGLFQCCHCVSGPVCVPVLCTVGCSVSMLSLCFRTSMCSCTMLCWMVCCNVVTVFAGPVCVPVPCSVGWSVSMLSLCFRTSMCSCTINCWMVCFNVVIVLAGPVCVLLPCTVGWSVSMLSLCLQDQYVFLHHALLDGLFQCCHCVSGPVCVPAPCTVGWSVSMLSLCFRTSMCSCTMHCWMVCFSVVTVFQDQYVFLHHALLDGLQTGHLAYPVSQYPDVYRTLCLDDEHMTELKTQFQVILSLDWFNTGIV